MLKIVISIIIANYSIKQNIYFQITNNLYIFMNVNKLFKDLKIYLSKTF